MLKEYMPETICSYVLQCWRFKESCISAYRSALLLLINPWLGKVDHGLRWSVSTSLHPQTPSLSKILCLS